MDDKRFRQAVMRALDRKFIAERIFFGTAQPAKWPISSATKFFDPNIHQYDFSSKKAEALLDEMGLKPGANGQRVTIKQLGLPYGESWNKLSPIALVRGP